jgi:tRNA U34 5-methylaminomethyl-2-thiouridine-forming methyltransferase MnmC
MSAPDLIITADGSHSLLNVELNETYHSVHGAIRESRHVFIREGLAYWLGRNTGRASVLEVGFGTGLNALLSLEASQVENREICYETLEAYPLEKEICQQLNYGDRVVGSDTLNELHECSWGKVHNLTNLFSFIKHEVRLEDFHVVKDSYDVIYYDAFAPSRQPDMWVVPILAKVVSGLRPAGIFVTYCAKGQLKRDLRDLGLRVETLPGPPGKKEMVRAVLEEGRKSFNL